ncbi:hypothetical protein I316_05673 [Kwoniella heveanensis BCC8398]|uniref:Uncharacterized protein n=1 Tax=Kwoniella heveanensis BCC8398 TaxID=1296120 RepID=A0A1B9GNW3_9TREE|nr:hypothetical protein I316_05673 [Kwoniella heveanensis BCC8398]
MAPKRTSRVKVIHSESEDEIVCRLSDANGDAGQEFSDSELTPPPPTFQEARLAQNHLQGKSKAKKASTGEGEEKPVKEKTGKDFENAVGRDQAAGEPVTKPRGKAAAGAAKIKGKGKKSDSSSAANSQRPTPALEGDAQVDPSNSAEGSASPTKKITLKLNVAGSARQTPVMDAEEASKERDVGVDNHAAAESSVAEGDTQSRKKQGKELSKAKTSVTPAPNEDEMKPSKKRKSVSLETDSNPVDAASTVVDQQREEGGGAKKLKLSLKARSQGDSRPVKKKKEQKGNTDSPDADGAEVEVKTPAKAKGKAKRAAGDDSNEQGAAPPAQEGEKVVKPNKKAKRIPEDEEYAPTAVRALPKGSPTKKDQVSPDTQSNNGPPQLESPNKKNAQLTVQTSSSPERATLTKSSPTRPLRPLKGKKPRRSQPISDDSDDDGSASRKTKAETSEKQRPKEKDSNGLARSKSTPNLANHNNATAAGSAQKKPLLKKKPVQKPAAGGGTGTPVQANKSSGPRMSLLGNTLAILQGTGSAAGTPKGKDGKKDNEIKKETPRVVRKGGWTDEWVLTAEQRKEFESHKAEREAERKKRDSWRVDPVNLQEAKDTYRVDSMQDRTIQVPGSMGIRTEGMASQAIKSILGF